MPNDQAPSEPPGLFPESLQITPATLVELAPRLAPYMPARVRDKSWPSIVDAAEYLSVEMGINRTLWARACTVMGREYTAVALAIVSTKQQGQEPGQIQSTPGGYFAGMVKKFEKNPQDLCLGRTIWGLKDEVWGKDGHKERRNVEHRRRVATRTKKHFHPDLDRPQRFPSREPARTSAGGFVPTSSVPQHQPTTRPVPPAPPTMPEPARTYWNPPPALLEEARQFGLRMEQSLQKYRGVDQPTKDMLAKPDSGTADPETPCTGEKS